MTDQRAAALLQNKHGAKRAVATFFGIGYLKPGPGTWASMAAVLLWGVAGWCLHVATNNRAALARGLAVFLACGIVLSICLGVPAASAVERQSGITDPGFVVIDEVAGQWIALLGAPLDWPHALIALVLFRLLDITKPFPVRRLEKLHGGWGIVFDDVAAGLYALGIASLLRIWY